MHLLPGFLICLLVVRQWKVKLFPEFCCTGIGEAVYRAFFHAMLAEGVALAPGAYEALFVGLAHTDDVLAVVGVAARQAAQVAAAARAAG